MLELRTRLRRICRSPAYMVAVVLSLGLGLSVTLAALSIANALVFRPLPGVSVRREVIRVEWTPGAPRLTNAEFAALALPANSPLTAVGAPSTPIRGSWVARSSSATGRSQSWALRPTASPGCAS